MGSDINIRKKFTLEVKKTQFISESCKYSAEFSGILQWQKYKTFIYFYVYFHSLSFPEVNKTQILQLTLGNILWNHMKNSMQLKKDSGPLFHYIQLPKRPPLI